MINLPYLLFILSMVVCVFIFILTPLSCLIYKLSSTSSCFLSRLMHPTPIFRYHVLSDFLYQIRFWRRKIIRETILQRPTKRKEDMETRFHVRLEKHGRVSTCVYASMLWVKKKCENVAWGISGKECERLSEKMWYRMKERV